MDIRMNDPVTMPVSRPQAAPPVERLIQRPDETAKAAETRSASMPTPEADVKKGVDEVNQALEALNHTLRFSVYEDTDQVQVKVVDTAHNDKVVKEIPADSVLELSGKIREMATMFQKMVGVLVDEFV